MINLIILIVSISGAHAASPFTGHMTAIDAIAQSPLVWERIKDLHRSSGSEPRMAFSSTD